ncbi:hypothetical protein [Vibrio gallaecicus]|uniref:hypothetical protein n=1 Tax=Vibrio gallaecicus TaxID=552386 RepID=UPI0025B4147D|nr:hypothetical protein [Vibrio gallaecicus]MDN3617701.1 hypothetical protein [Vibrio gallaecicus]
MDIILQCDLNEYVFIRNFNYRLAQITTQFELICNYLTFMVTWLHNHPINKK